MAQAATNLTLAWDPCPEADFYTLYVDDGTDEYYRLVDTKEPWATVKLEKRVVYKFYVTQTTLCWRNAFTHEELINAFMRNWHAPEIWLWDDWADFVAIGESRFSNEITYDNCIVL